MDEMEDEWKLRENESKMEEKHDRKGKQINGPL